MSGVVWKVKPPKPNIMEQAWIALSQLKANKGQIILPADKGNVTVVMNTEDYSSKIFQST